MTNQEMRELDAWIAENVMQWRRTFDPDGLTTSGETLFWHRKESNRDEIVVVGESYSRIINGVEMFSHSWKNFHPTIDPTAAMMVLDKCAKKLAEFNESIDIEFHKSTEWNVNVCAMYYGVSYEARLETQAESLPLAICLFAKKLFER